MLEIILEVVHYLFAAGLVLLCWNLHKRVEMLEAWADYDEDSPEPEKLMHDYEGTA